MRVSATVAMQKSGSATAGRLIVCGSARRRDGRSRDGFRERPTTNEMARQAAGSLGEESATSRKTIGSQKVGPECAQSREPEVSVKMAGKDG